MKAMRTGDRKWVLLAAVVLVVALCGVGTLHAGTYLSSPHGDTTNGVERDSTEGYAVGHCAHCHDPHSGTSGGYNLRTTITDNGICFVNTGSGSGCHQTQPNSTTPYSCDESDRVAGSDAENGQYFESSSTGVLNRCRWPGEAVWEVTSSQSILGSTRYVSPHRMDSDMPLRDGTYGLCSNCHDPHGVSGGSLDTQLDMLISVYNTPGSSSNYGMCFNVTLNGTSYDCHSDGVGTPTTSNGGNDLIKGFYDSSDGGAGHQIRCSTKTVQGTCPPSGSGITVGDRMPCYNCHNPHGSEGANGSNANYFLLSDQPDRGWSGLTMTAATQIRTFCFGCHVASNGSGTKMVMGITLKTIPSLSAHETSSTTSCYSCHNNDYTAGGQNVHNPSMGGDCITCHSSSVSGSTYTRRAITGEFGLAWGHLDSTRDSVGNDDCVVCHMEGNSTSDPTPSTLHMDEAVDLRDPDTGTQIIYGGSTYKFGQFSRNTASSALETAVLATQNMHCLKCHDTNGASNSAARVTDVGASATNPWNQSGVTRLDVATQFATTNATFHPVRGKQNNDFCDTDTMVSPWNQFSKTPGTPLEDGNLITCFDCHNAVSELSTGSIAAHGGSVTLRAAYTRGNYGTPICLECHKASVYWVTSSTTVTVSAFGPNTYIYNKGAWQADDDAGHPNASYSGAHHEAGEAGFINCGCLCCHSRTRSATQPTRPAAAEDTHGYNALAGGGNWNYTGAPPYSFWRATDALYGWGPRNYTYSAGNHNDTTRGYCNDSSPAQMCGQGRGTYQYAPAGTY